MKRAALVVLAPLIALVPGSSANAGACNDELIKLDNAFSSLKTNQTLLTEANGQLTVAMAVNDRPQVLGTRALIKQYLYGIVGDAAVVTEAAETLKAIDGMCGRKAEELEYYIGAADNAKNTAAEAISQMKK